MPWKVVMDPRTPLDTAGEAALRSSRDSLRIVVPGQSEVTAAVSCVHMTALRKAMASLADTDVKGRQEQGEKKAVPWTGVSCWFSGGCYRVGSDQGSSINTLQSLRGEQTSFSLSRRICLISSAMYFHNTHRNFRAPQPAVRYS